MDVIGLFKGGMSMSRPPSKDSRRARKYNLELAERIRAFRRERGLSQAELANRIDEVQRVVSHYELGQRRLPAETLLKIARVLRVSLPELTNGKIQPAQPKNGRRVRTIIEKLETLPPKKQQQVVEYVEFISRSDQRAA